jgi:hypothetical protein
VGWDVCLSHESCRQRCTERHERLVDCSKTTTVRSHEYFGPTTWGLLRDWELIKLLNPLADKPRSPVFAAEARADHGVMDLLAAAQQHVEAQFGALDLPFKLATVERLACLLPGIPETAGAPPPDEGARHG